MNGRLLIVNADDFGLTAGVDHGIEAAVRAGAVTSVSVMANLARGTAVAALAAGHPQLSLGAHLNLTTGRPVLGARAVPSLVGPGGEFHPLDVLTRRVLCGRVRANEVRAELDAQLAVLAAAGVTVDHVDSHEHVHLLPGVTGVVVAVARGAGIRCIRSHRPRLLPVDGRGSKHGSWRAVAAYYRRHPRRLLTHGLKHALAARLHLGGLRTPGGMVGGALLLEPVGGGPLAEWDAVCAALPEGVSELVVHPADVRPAGDAQDDAQDLARLGELVARRAAELAALESPGFAAMVAARGITLASFAEVSGEPRPSASHASEEREERHVARGT